MVKKGFLISTSTFPKYQDDPETSPFVWDLAKHLTPYYQLFVLAPYIKGVPREETWHKVKIIRFPYLPAGKGSLIEGGRMHATLTRHPLRHVQLPPFFLSQIFYLKKLISQFQISFINSHWLVPQGLTGATVSKMTGVPHVVTVHSADLYWLRRQRFGHVLTKVIAANTNRFICVSQINKELLDGLLRRTSEAEIISMGVDSNLFVLPKDGVRRSGFLFVGKLIEIKGGDILIRAWQNLVQSDSPPHLTIIGDGPWQQKLTNLVKKGGLEKFITFLGSIPHSQLVKYYQSAQALIIPSRLNSHGQVEGLPVVILEALACGTPVIATNTGGIPEVINSKTGVLIPPEKPGLLAQTIKNFQPHCFDSQELSRLAQTYSWEKIAQKYHQVFSKITK